MNAIFGKLLRPLRAGEKHLAWNRVGDASGAITLASPAFTDGGPMPRKYAGEGMGSNVSPPLQFSGVPRGTAELVLIMQDPDVPLPRPAVHLIARLPGGARSVGEDGLTLGHAVFFGKGSFGRYGYAGPRPIRGHGPHRYVFQLFALGRTLDGLTGTTLKAHLAAMRGHVLARGRLTGTYEQR